MDLFDMTDAALEELQVQSSAHSTQHSGEVPPPSPRKTSHSKSHPPPVKPPPHLVSLAQGMKPLANTPVLVLGVQSDILFTVEQQREVADALRMAGNEQVSYYELGGVWGHDTFLCVSTTIASCSILTRNSHRIDVLNVGGAIRGFLT
jgi:homoserine O-acetyltransferase